MTNIISIIAGSKSDESIVKNAESILNEFEIPYETHFISAHRNPDMLREYLKSNKDTKVYICIAGLSAALPGVVASQVICPVIGVPVESKLGGLDSLLSIVQMPSGIPVACVAIDNSKNAALLAIEILALENKELEKKLIEYREKLRRG
jgi:5-(carboxyamino)imidazole ribonucleotide mutase